MEELIKRLRDGTTVPLMEERHAVADVLEAQQAEISSFCMNYRMKCDEETKSLHIQIEAQQARIAELEAKLGAKPNWKIVLLPEKQNGQSKG